MTLVSIIIPCYNQEAYLDTTVTSVLNQKHEHWECILVNDGSTDKTQDIINNWVKKDSRFIGIQQKNGGLSNARNKGLENAKGEWVQFLDADDFLHDSKLSSSLSQNTDVVVTDFLMFKDTPENTLEAYCNLKTQTFSFESILCDWDVTYTIPIHCGLFRRSLIGNVKFNESVKAKEDWIFWLSLFQKTPSVSFVPEQLCLYRLHEKSMTQNEAFMFENTVKAFEFIYSDFLKDEKYKHLFFNRVVREYEDFKSRYFYFSNSNKEVLENYGAYKYVRDKYYNIWYKKYFYMFFKPKKYKKIYS